MEGGYFQPQAEGSPAENFSVAIPPPNVTGALHMGHALNGAMQDALVRMNRMRGRNALWTLGTDHAGIATQAVVEKMLAAEGTSRQEIGREAFVERVWAWKEEYGSRIVEQYKRLGASCDYENERFTLDEGYVRAVYRVFKQLYDKGYIYRDNYMVNWDPGSHSAISDLEVENREVEDTLYSIDYPVEGSDRVLTVATVRPETMLADTAVAVNPGDERYADLVGKHCLLPLLGRRIPVIADEHVDPEFGTGALKITPGHDPNDFEIGRRHGLEEIGVIGPDGRMSEEAGERFAGLTAAEAQEAVVAALREEGRLRDEEPYVHSVPFSERSGARIEPLISLQWFCRMDELAAPAIEAVRARPRCGSRRSAGSASTSTGCARSAPGASRASSGGGTGSRSGTATPARRPTSPSRRRSAAAPAAASCARRRTCSTPGSARRCGPSRRSAGPRRRRGCAPSTRPASSPRRARSSSSGWRGW